ncbi:MAG: DUF4911 domain-containing protein [bacterium]
MNVPQEILILVKVSKEKESFVQSILEGYDGLVTILSTQKVGQEIEMFISSTDHQKDELLEILENLALEIPLSFREVQ